MKSRFNISAPNNIKLQQFYNKFVCKNSINLSLSILNRYIQYSHKTIFESNQLPLASIVVGGNEGIPLYPRPAAVIG